jgi:hypothetical protein
MAAKRGVELHDLAHRLITLGQYLPEVKKTLNMYVNAAMEYGMASEQLLYYSDNCFGTADSIGFRDGLLRIHDLKTGESPTSEKQLFVYAALYCLEYGVSPFDINFELRIYQNNEVAIFYPDPEEIERIMNKIVEFNELIEALKQEDLA